MNHPKKAPRPVLRFAPSPNGALHLGHAYSALLNAESAALLGGRLLLRIEDIDTARCTTAFEAAILRDLGWLGLVWEEPVRRQSEHFDDYRAALDRLVADGLAYPAFMSRGEVRAHIVRWEASGATWPRDPDGAPLYPGVDRHLGKKERSSRIASGAPFAWRLDVEAALERAAGLLEWFEAPDAGFGSTRAVAADPAAWGDVVLARRDVPTSYHLSVVVDDALQHVTHIVRGADLFSATSVHRLLQHLLGLDPPVYHHHRLILGEDGRKLAKSDGAASLRALIETGATPDDVRRRVGLA